MELKFKVVNKTGSRLNLSWMLDKYQLAPGQTYVVEARDTALFNGKKSKSKNAREALEHQISSGQIDLIVLTDMPVSTFEAERTVPQKPGSSQVTEELSPDQEVLKASMDEAAKLASRRVPDQIKLVRSETAEESESLMTPVEFSRAGAGERTLDVTNRSLYEAHHQEVKPAQLGKDIVARAEAQEEEEDRKSREEEAEKERKKKEAEKERKKKEAQKSKTSSGTSKTTSGKTKKSSSTRSSKTSKTSKSTTSKSK